MTDKPHAHNLTAQILSSYCQAGKIMLFQEGADVGKFLGSAYQELFNHIIKAEESKPAGK